MKANHNPLKHRNKEKTVVTNLNISKNESKSQLGARTGAGSGVVTNLNISKNESKSQPLTGRPPDEGVVTNLNISKNESKSQHA